MSNNAQETPKEDAQTVDPEAESEASHGTPAQSLTNAKQIEEPRPQHIEKVIRVPPSDNTVANSNIQITGAMGTNLFTQEQLSNINAVIVDSFQNMTINTGMHTINDEDLIDMFTQLTGQSDTSFIPLMQDILKNVVTRQVLYTPLKALLDNYTPWLEENRAHLSKADLERYTQQRTILEEVCNELMTENETDSEEVKMQRVDRIMSAMYRMQELGSPPEELTRDVIPRLQFDPQGNPILPEGINMNNLETLCTII